MGRRKRSITEIADHQAGTCPHLGLHPFACAFEEYARFARSERVLNDERGIMGKEEWLNTPSVVLGFDPHMRLQFAFSHRGNLTHFTSQELRSGSSVRHILETLNGLSRLILNGPPGQVS